MLMPLLRRARGEDVSGLVAQIDMRGGRAEQAIALLDEMLARAERLGLGLHQAEFHGF